jgi:hypothetical protein
MLESNRRKIFECWKVIEGKSESWKVIEGKSESWKVIEGKK